MTTIQKIIGWAMIMLILPAVMPVLIVLVLNAVLDDPSIAHNDGRIKELTGKAVKISLIPVIVLGVISIKALGIYMVVGSIIGIILLLTYHYYVK